MQLVLKASSAVISVVTRTVMLLAESTPTVTSNERSVVAPRPPVSYAGTVKVLAAPVRVY